jgi:hypothetical protein
VGIGTAAYALLIGPLAHRFIPLLAIRPKKSQPIPQTQQTQQQTQKPEKRRPVAGGQLAGENC